MESRPLVPLRAAQVVLRLAGAELPEVLGRLGHRVLEELEGYAAQRLAWWSCCVRTAAPVCTIRKQKGGWLTSEGDIKENPVAVAR